MTAARKSVTIVSAGEEACAGFRKQINLLDSVDQLEHEGERG